MTQENVKQIRHSGRTGDYARQLAEPSGTAIPLPSGDLSTSTSKKRDGGAGPVLRSLVRQNPRQRILGASIASDPRRSRGRKIGPPIFRNPSGTANSDNIIRTTYVRFAPIAVIPGRTNIQLPGYRRAIQAGCCQCRCDKLRCDEARRGGWPAQFGASECYWANRAYPAAHFGRICIVHIEKMCHCRVNSCQ